ncbi:MAG TPA: hypothetical protein VNO30_44950 [Kofleriaceae bacterium]|nr:hypothetical protein [Kofleriaceae bacterium]
MAISRSGPGTCRARIAVFARLAPLAIFALGASPLLAASCKDSVKPSAVSSRSDGRSGGNDVSSSDKPTATAPADPSASASAPAAPPSPAPPSAPPAVTPVSGGPGAVAPSVAPSATPAPRAPRFEVVNQKLTDAELEKMIAAGKLASAVVEVKLSSNQLTAHALELLAKSPLVQLQLLDIYDNPIGDAGAKVIAREPLYRGVDKLNLGHTGMTLAGVQALIGKDSKLTGPTSLQIQGAQLGDAGLDALLASRFAKHLTTLNLSKTGITDAGAKRLAESKALPSLTYLDVSRNQLSPASVAALRKMRMDLRVQAD